MNKLFLAALVLFACNQTKHEEIITEDYELHLPAGKIEAILILFPGYPEDAISTKREFKILNAAKKAGIAVLFSNYNRKLWLNVEDKENLTNQISATFKEHNLPTDNIYIGGFSSGGNVAMLIGNYMMSQEVGTPKPKGVFVVDSPVDLVQLYRNADYYSKNSTAENLINEGQWIIQSFDQQLGDPDSTIDNYESNAVYTSQTDNIDNISQLRNTKLRFYTEPDTTWWREYGDAGFERINAFQITNLYESLKEKGFQKVELITTVNKGYRSDGSKHPHSWSIVDVTELVEWMTE